MDLSIDAWCGEQTENSEQTESKAKRGPMDNMIQLVRILSVLIPASNGIVQSDNRISEEMIHLFLNETLGEAPRPLWGIPSGYGAYLAELFTWAKGEFVNDEDARRCVYRPPGRPWNINETNLQHLGKL